MQKLVDKLMTQRGIEITHHTIPGAGHLFDGKLDEVTDLVEGYVHGRMAEAGAA